MGKNLMKRYTARTLAVLCTLCAVLLFHCLQGNAWARFGVSTDKNTYHQGEEIQVRFFGAPGYSSDWICIVPSGAPDTDAGDYQYMPNGLHQGFLTFAAPSSGRYEVRAFYNYSRGRYLVSDRRSFIVEGQRYSGGSRYQDDPDNGPVVSTNKNTYHQGEEIQVYFSGAPGYSSDWICIVPSGAPDTEAGDYQYLPNGAQQGSLTFVAPAYGHYEVRAFYDYRRNGYLVTGRHSFTVESQRYSGGARYQDDSAGPPYPGQDARTPDPQLKQAQDVLIERGYDPGEADGFYGGKTRSALRAFQRDNKIKQSGRLDRMTLEILGLL